jgi:GTP-binding protein
MSKLWQARFFTTVNHLSDLPDTQMPEIAFAGRSNAGKSTAINILCNHKVDEIRAMLVDLPGYGYAEVSGSAKRHWQQLLGSYVQTRPQLAALMLIMDSRRPFTPLDMQMLEWFAPTGKPIHCILTKVDKLNRNDSINALRMARTVLASYVDSTGHQFPFTAQLFSAQKRIGIEEANEKILELSGLSQDIPEDIPEDTPDDTPDPIQNGVAEQ